MIKIINAAVKIKLNDIDLIICAERPTRHHNIIHALYKIGIKNDSREQGFLTSDGCFVGRKDAAKIAIKSRQIDKLKHPPNLFSEDLW